MNGPAMEAAIAEIETGGFAEVASLLVLASETVDHRFAMEWIEMLKSLKRVAT
jgi:hypothetical protein